MPGLIHAVERGGAHTQHFALRTLFLLSGVPGSVLKQLASAASVSTLANRAWHGRPDVQVRCTPCLKARPV